MINRIESLKTSLSKSERKVADVVLAQPNLITNMSMADIAMRAGVSEATVVRFCRAVGCTGFQTLKIRLIGDLARTIPYVHREVHLGDSCAELSEKLFERTISTLMRVKSHIEADALEAAVAILADARRIEFFGQGASGMVAADAQNKFSHLGIPCAAHSDGKVQAMLAGVLDEKAAVVAISFGGESKGLLHAVEIARQSGARIVAITTARAPLAALAHVAIHLDEPEDSGLQTEMTTRILQLMVLDVLQVGLDLRHGATSARNGERGKTAIGGHRLA